MKIKNSKFNMKNFALVYLVDEDNENKLQDIADDPCFDKPPTWGICRPDIRNEKELKDGSYLLFIARKFINNERKYLLKGYFRVKSKIDIIEAYQHFGQRRNVIISSQQRKIPQTKWRNYEWKRTLKQYILSETIPNFLKTLKVREFLFYQRDVDCHEIDNWKCRRIFNCNIRSFKNCVSSNKCIKELQNISFKKNYVVGDENDFADWNSLKIEWKEVAVLIKKKEDPMDKRNNRHPEIELTDSEFKTIKSYIIKKYF